MEFKNTSIFFIPVSYDDYEEFVGWYEQSARWEKLSAKETATQYLLDYAYQLSVDSKRFCGFRYRDPAAAPIYLYEDTFGDSLRIDQIRLSCFSTGIGFLEIWIDYGSTPLDRIIDFSYRFKKAKISSRVELPENKQSLYDFAESVLYDRKSRLFFPYSAPFKCECFTFHILKEEHASSDELSEKLYLLKHSYNSGFTDWKQEPADYDMTYIPYGHDLWGGSQEGLVNLVTKSSSEQTDYFIHHYKYEHLIRDYRFIYLLLLNQRFSAIKYISMISTANYNQIDHSELRQKLILLKTSFSFRVISVEMMHQNIYSKMYDIFKIDELLEDISENEELVAFQQGQKMNETEKRSNKLLYAISILSVFSALIDSASFFDRLSLPWLPRSATLLSVICVAIGIHAVLFNKKK